MISPSELRNAGRRATPCSGCYGTTVLGSPNLAVLDRRTVQRGARATSIQPASGAASWTLGTLYVKLVQCMALRIPMFDITPGRNTAAIEDGHTGFLADTGADWLRIVDRLVEDNVLREQIQMLAAYVAHERYRLTSKPENVVPKAQRGTP